MIELTRLDGEAFVLNADLIKYVEARPDTFITLVSNDRIVVSETPREVMQRALYYQQTKRLIPNPPAGGSSSGEAGAALSVTTAAGKVS